MHEIVEEKVNYLQDQITATIKLNEDVELVEKLMPEAGIWLDGEVNVDWAVKGIEDVKAVLRKFALEGILLDLFNEHPSSPTWYLKGVGGKIRLSPTWTNEHTEGATCRLVKTGESTYSYPTYKLVCKDKNGNDVEMKEAQSE